MGSACCGGNEGVAPPVVRSVMCPGSPLIHLLLTASSCDVADRDIALPRLPRHTRTRGILLGTRQHRHIRRSSMPSLQAARRKSLDGQGFESRRVSLGLEAKTTYSHELTKNADVYPSQLGGNSMKSGKNTLRSPGGAIPGEPAATDRAPIHVNPSTELYACRWGHRPVR